MLAQILLILAALAFAFEAIGFPSAARLPIKWWAVGVALYLASLAAA